MITVQKKKDCCGCSACMEICPQKCIGMIADSEGFDYPTVNAEKCIKCGLCTKVCPVLNQGNPHLPSKIYAAINPDNQIRQQSSSGGIFSMLAENIINEGGIVFGASFDNQWNVKHNNISQISDLYKFRGSKYVQSSINGQFPIVQRFLKDGKKVLFSGTPCQIAGLKTYLGKEYTLLYTVDFICHGVPSPTVWQAYLSEISKQYSIDRSLIHNINFRNKSIGWKKFSFSIQYTKHERNRVITEVFYKNYYIRGFLHNIYLRPSCYACPSKSGKSKSDITIADFWGIQHIFPDMNHLKGISMVMVNSSKGETWYQQLNISSKETDYQTVFPYNKSIELSAECPEKKREQFFRQFKKKRISSLIIRLTNYPLSERIKNKILNILSTINQ